MASTAAVMKICFFLMERAGCVSTATAFERRSSGFLGLNGCGLRLRRNGFLAGRLFMVGRACMVGGSLGLHLGALLGVEIADNACHVRPGLAIRRDTMVLVHAMGAGIVCGQRFQGVVVVQIKQCTQVCGTGFHV